MSSCCFCFKKKRQVTTNDTIIQREPSDHYQMLTQEPHRKLSTRSIGSKPGTETPLESSIDSSPVSAQPEPRHSIHSVHSFNTLLYFPSKDPLRSCSDLVTAQFQNFTKILELEASSDWEIKIDKPFACIMLKPGTQSHPDIPLMKAFFDMEINANPEDLYEIMYWPETRKRWDNSIGSFFEISRSSEDVIQYYMHNKAPWPFKDRDFVETRYIRKRVNGDIEIFFTSLEHNEHPENKDKAIRGETIMGAQIMRKRISPITGNYSLYVTTICQADMKGEVPKKALKVTLPSSLLKWYRGIKKQLQIKIESA